MCPSPTQLLAQDPEVAVSHPAPSNTDGSNPGPQCGLKVAFTSSPQAGGGTAAQLNQLQQSPPPSIHKEKKKATTTSTLFVKEL